jgi:hypothetical protein
LKGWACCKKLFAIPVFRIYYNLQRRWSMPKITADIPEELYRFVRGRIVDQRLEGEPTTVSTLVTDLLYKWKSGGLALATVADGQSVGQQASGAPLPSIVHPAVRLSSLRLDAKAQEIARLIAAARLEEAQKEKVFAALVEILPTLIKLQCE